MNVHTTRALPFIFDENTPHTAAERYRQGFVRLFEFAESLAAEADAALLAGNPESANGLYSAASKVLNDSTAQLYGFIIAKSCAGEA